MRLVGQNGEIMLTECFLQSLGISLKTFAQLIVGVKMFDRRSRSRHNRRRLRCGENEASRLRAYHIHQSRRAGDITSHRAKSFTESPADDIDSVHSSPQRATRDMGVVIEMFGNTRAVWTVQSHGVNFVQKGDCSILLAQIDDFTDRGNSTCIDLVFGNHNFVE